MIQLKAEFEEEELHTLKATSTEKAITLHAFLRKHYLWHNKYAHSGKKWARVIKANMLKMGEK
jgi:hypothetical protein